MTDLFNTLICIVMFCLVPAPFVWGLGYIIYLWWEEHTMR